MQKCIPVILILALAWPASAQDVPHASEKGEPEAEKVSPEEIAGAVEALSSRYVRERGKARRKLIKAGQPALKPLLKALEAQSPCVRAAAAEILGFIGDGSAVPGIAKLLRDAHLAVRVQAREALVRIGPAGLKYIAGSLVEGEIRPEDFAYVLSRIVETTDWDREARGQLTGLDKEVVAALVEALKDKSPSIRAAIAGVLGLLGGEAAAPALVKLMKDEDETVRAAAGEALARIGPAAIKYIAEFLESDTEAERKEFKLVISRMVKIIFADLIGPDNSFGTYPGQFDELKKISRFAVPALVEMAMDRTRPSGWCYLAVSALGCLNDKSAMPALKDIYHTGGTFLRDAAALSLAELGDDSCVKELIHEYETKLKQGPQKHIQHSELALIYHKLKDWEKAETHYKGAIKANPGYGLAYYNYACFLSVKGRTKEAVAALKSALENGYTDGGWLVRDKELDNIRSLPEYKQLIKKHFPKTPDNK